MNPNAVPEPGGRPARSCLLPILVGCRGVVVLGMVLLVAGLVWLGSGPESGVKTANEMDKYALDYLDRHKILNGTETLIAYYDATIAMDGTEAAILTTERVLYHKDGRTTALPLRDVTDVRHHNEGLTGDVIEVVGRRGQLMKIEIAPMNDGKVFLDALRDAWKAAKTSS